MAFCGTCGMKLNGQAFCPNCGTPVENEIMVSENTSLIYGQPKSAREKALEELDSVIVHFGGIADKFDTFLEKTLEMENRKQRKILRWVFSMPAWFILFLILDDKFLHNLPDFIRWIPFLASIILPIVIPIYLKIKNAAAIHELDKETDKLSMEFLDHYNAYPGECPVGFDFFNMISLSMLRNLIIDNRASTVSQAINLLVDDMHKNRMEQQLAQTKSAAEAAAYYSKDASIHSRAAARSASRAADAAEGAFWNTL